MTDLVERLRTEANDWDEAETDGFYRLLNEAADRIAELEAELAEREPVAWAVYFDQHPDCEGEPPSDPLLLHKRDERPDLESPGWLPHRYVPLYK